MELKFFGMITLVKNTMDENKKNIDFIYDFLRGYNLFHHLPLNSNHGYLLDNPNDLDEYRLRCINFTNDVIEIIKLVKINVKEKLEFNRGFSEKINRIIEVEFAIKHIRQKVSNLEKFGFNIICKTEYKKHEHDI